MRCGVGWLLPLPAEAEAEAAAVRNRTDDAAEHAAQRAAGHAARDAADHAATPADGGGSSSSLIMAISLGIALGRHQLAGIELPRDHLDHLHGAAAAAAEAAEAAEAAAPPGNWSTARLGSASK